MVLSKIKRAPVYWANARRPDPTLAGMTIRWYQKIGGVSVPVEGVMTEDGRTVLVGNELIDYLLVQGRL